MRLHSSRNLGRCSSIFVLNLRNRAQKRSSLAKVLIDVAADYF